MDKEIKENTNNDRITQFLEFYKENKPADGSRLGFYINEKRHSKFKELINQESIINAIKNYKKESEGEFYRIEIDGNKYALRDLYEIALINEIFGNDSRKEEYYDKIYIYTSQKEQIYNLFLDLGFTEIIFKNNNKNSNEIKCDENLIKLINTEKYKNKRKILFEKLQQKDIENKVYSIEDFDKLIDKYDNNGMNNSGDTSMDNQNNDIDLDKLSLNTIFYGPPGTGKTHIMHEIVSSKRKSCYNAISKLSSLDKLLFAFKKDVPPEGIKDCEIVKLPTMEFIRDQYKDKKAQRGAFTNTKNEKAIRNGYIQKSGNDILSLTDDGNKKAIEICKNIYQKIYGKEKLDNKSKNETEEDNLINQLIKDINEKLNKEWFKYKFVTFHQSYSYEEFVEGIRPVIAPNNNNETQNNNKKCTSGDCKFEYHDGIFKNLCKEALKDENKDKTFYLFIDEINRGNISKIFGELITLIEPDKRENVTGDTDIDYHTIEVTLPYSNEPFTVPNNLYIIGTMNTADKSLALLDVALRRRFEFIPMYPKYEKDVKYKAPELSTFLKSLNEQILKEKKGSADYLIGHAYFMNKEEKDLPDILNKHVIPLLMEYFNGNKETVKTILEEPLDKTTYEIDDSEEYLLKVKDKEEINPKSDEQ